MHDHASHEMQHDCANCGHQGTPPMCSCDHNPGGECHCPPNECKCDQSHHLIGETQMDHSCCKSGAPHQHEGAGHDHDMHAGHDMHAMHGHDHSGHDMHAGHGHDHSGHDMHAGHDHSHHDPGMFKKQFWFAFALTIPTMYFSHTVHTLLGYPMISFAFSEYIPAVLGVVLFFTGGRVFLKTGWQEVKSKQPGMMALIALALIVAFGYSSFITVTQIFDLGWVGMDFWWELAALVVIMLLGHWIEMASVMGAQNAVGALAKLVPDTADKVDGERISPVAVSQLKVGDVVLVRPGAAIPIDGVVIDGSSKVDESMVTGESAAVAKEIGSEVIAGTINATSAALGQGALTIRVTKVGSQTMLSNIIRLVQAAQASKSKTQLLADRAAGWLFYVALGSAVATAVVWSVLGTQTTDYVLERIVTVLVIACPHALGLAIPLVTSITTAKAARGGLIIRSRKDFESLRKVDVVVFDKTGTLTIGKRTVIESTAVGTSMRELVALAAGLERYSEHPLAKSIVEFAEKWEYEPLDVKDFRVVPGVGVSGIYESSNILVGGPAMLTQRGVVLEVQHLVDVNSQNEAGNTVVFVLRDSKLLGWISIGDEVRESAASAVAELKRMGKKVVMLSGDAHGVVARVAGDLGIDEFFAEVLPQHKVEVIEKLQGEKKVVAMVGDGVNDAPALARAEVGIAIGAGTDVAIESAGLVLVSSDPAGIAGAVALSQRSYSKMVQNLIWGAGYNALAIPLAAGVFAGVGFVLSPALGAVLMSLSTIIVAANAQLLRR